VTVDSKGDVFGTISGEGGVIGNGQAFEIPAGSKSATMLASFDNVYNQEFPDGVIEDGQGNLFGTAAIGGSDGVGSIFEIAKGSSTPIALAGFNGAAPAPKGLVADAQGNLYGTDAGGGSQGYGSVYELAKGSNTITPLATFNGLDGAGISNVTIDPQGNLFGTTEDGGMYGAGSIFEIAKGSNTATTLASFDTLNGSEPDRLVGVVEDAQGDRHGLRAGQGLGHDHHDRDLQEQQRPARQRSDARRPGRPLRLGQRVGRQRRLDLQDHPGQDRRGVDELTGRIGKLDLRGYPGMESYATREEPCQANLRPSPGGSLKGTSWGEPEGGGA
jgi:uncharacterized repeat protein (TIGR03803 family)